MGWDGDRHAAGGGNDIELIDTDPERAQSLAEELSGRGGESARALGPGDNIGGDVVVLGLYYPVIADVVRQCGDRLAGRTVIDIANPADFDTMDGLVTFSTARVPTRRPGSSRPQRPW